MSTLLKGTIPGFLGSPSSNLIFVWSLIDKSVLVRGMVSFMNYFPEKRWKTKDKVNSITFNCSGFSFHNSLCKAASQSARNGCDIKAKDMFYSPRLKIEKYEKSKIWSKMEHSF